VLGAWYRPTPDLEIGLSGQVIPADVEAESTLSVQPVRPEEVPGEVELLRDGRPASDVRLRLPLPLTARAGVRYAIGSEGSDVELDVSYTTWSRVQRVSVFTDGMIASLYNNPVPLEQIDIEKRWEDVIGVNLGGDVVVAPDLLTLRAGTFYETAAAPPAYANVDAIVSQSMGGALGASLLFGDLELAITHEQRIFPEHTVAESNARVYQQVPGSPCDAPYTDPMSCRAELLGQPSVAVNAGTYSAHVHATSLDVLYRF
jgi:hypothetical protein